MANIDREWKTCSATQCTLPTHTTKNFKLSDFFPNLQSAQQLDQPFRVCHRHLSSAIPYAFLQAFQISGGDEDDLSRVMAKFIVSSWTWITPPRGDKRIIQDPDGSQDQNMPDSEAKSPPSRNKRVRT